MLSSQKQRLENRRIIGLGLKLDDTDKLGEPEITKVSGIITTNQSIKSPSYIYLRGEGK